MCRIGMKIFLALLVLVAPKYSFGQGKNEFSVHIKNGILFNKAGLENLSGGETITRMKNTLTQMIGGSYTRVTRSGLLLSAGVEGGYERYAFSIDFPFTEYGYRTPAALSSKYKFSSTIPYGQIVLSIGYRYKKPKKLQPEIRISQIVNIPFKGFFYSNSISEESVYGLSDENIRQYGYVGKADGGFMMNLINSVYLGTKINTAKVKGIGVGVSMQNQFLKNDATSIYSQYTNFFGSNHTERFSNTHLAFLAHISMDL